MTQRHPIHNLPCSGSVSTAGRVREEEGDLHLGNARRTVPLEWSGDPPALSGGELLEVSGRWTGESFEVETHRVVHRPEADAPFGVADAAIDPEAAVRRRTELYRGIRDYFEARDFLEVETPHAVHSPGTDIYLEPVATRSPEAHDRRTVPPWLHTSPEFAMKRMLADGFERIYQIARVWRDGEMTDLHHPEFSLLEWYRAWESVGRAMADCEQIVTDACDGRATVRRDRRADDDEFTVSLDPPFERMTMRELVGEAAGFDILESLDYPDLRRHIDERGLLAGDLDRRHPPEDGRWDDLFFELMVSVLEPYLADRGAVFITEWPAPLAILARRSEDDPRVANRFELFIGGIELANGFDELTDPDEQRRRFEDELADRRAQNRPTPPLPRRFLRALEYGIPPSAGVALGLDRLLMLATGASSLPAVAPFAADRMEASE